MANKDFILGLLDILRNFLDIFVKMLKDFDRPLNGVDTSLVQIKDKQVADTARAPVNTDMQENEFRSWTNRKNTKAPKEIENLEPSNFFQVFQFMEIPYNEAKAKYFEMLDGHIGEMVNESAGFKQQLNSALALAWFVPAD